MPATTSATRLASRRTSRRKSRSAGCVAKTKWFSVFAVLLLATAIDGVSIFDANRAALEMTQTDQAVAIRASDARPDLIHEVSTTGSIDAVAEPAGIVTPICPVAPDPLKS